MIQQTSFHFILKTIRNSDFSEALTGIKIGIGPGRKMFSTIRGQFMKWKDCKECEDHEDQLFSR